MTSLNQEYGQNEEIWPQNQLNLGIMLFRSSWVVPDSIHSHSLYDYIRLLAIYLSISNKNEIF